ncbi:MAG: ribosome maturation factor RimP [Defluviitaleaceae bacterium]|nr:ribosome maturation factor RimP [Defluviitaleaceae bacterium]
MTNKDIISKIYDILEPVLNVSEIKIWDIEMVKEGKNLYLRVYIDKDNGVSIDDCEYISKYISNYLDEIDPIEDPYILEVSSPGINRLLKKESDFLLYIGSEVDVKLYKMLDGSKLYTGILEKYENETVTINCNNKIYSFTKKDIASVRIAITF